MAYARNSEAFFLLTILIVTSIFSGFGSEAGAVEAMEAEGARIPASTSMMILPPGTAAPSHTLLDLQQTPRTFPATGSWSVVFFWSMFCQACLEEIPDLAEEVKKPRTIDLQPFFVSLDTKRMARGIQNFLKKRQIDCLVLLEEISSGSYLTADSWGVRATPATFIVDPQGTIVYSQEGPLDIADFVGFLTEIERTNGIKPQTETEPATEPEPKSGTVAGHD